MGTALQGKAEAYLKWIIRAIDASGLNARTSVCRSWTLYADSERGETGNVSRKDRKVKTMGKVEKAVKKHEAEKHIDTAEYIDTLRWYIKACGDIDQEWTRAKADLNEAFNARLRELREKREAK